MIKYEIYLKLSKIPAYISNAQSISNYSEKNVPTQRVAE